MLLELTFWLFLLTALIFALQKFAIFIVIAFSAYFLLMRLLEKVRVNNLSQKAVLITGCDRGFGFELALKCIRSGMPVFACCLTEEGVNSLVKVARTIKDGEKLLNTCILDVSSEESVQKARKFVGERISLYKDGLWAVVNNAGACALGLDDWTKESEYQKCFDVNTLGMIRMARTFNDLIKESRGRHILTSSILGRVAMPFMSAYCVSKHAIAAYTDILRIEMAPFGVTVIGIEPGYYRTTMTNLKAAKEYQEKVWKELPANVRLEYGDNALPWAQNVMDKFDSLSTNNMDKVVDAYYSSITSAFPRKRWQVGYTAGLLFTPFTFLPTHWQLWLMRLHFEVLMKRPKSNVAIKRC